jgi:hypothetical protein
MAIYTTLPILAISMLHCALWPYLRHIVLIEPYFLERRSILCNISFQLFLCVYNITFSGEFWTGPVLWSRWCYGSLICYQVTVTIIDKKEDKGCLSFSPKKDPLSIDFNICVLDLDLVVLLQRYYTVHIDWLVNNLINTLFCML